MKRVFILLLLVACSPAVTFDNGASFSVELARTAQEKQKGLMFRESLPVNSGMLFVFDDEKSRSFWMKNTIIPLDMIYIASNYSVVEVKENVPPCEADPCPTYSSLPAKYVLEINGGLASKNNIVVGSTMNLRE